MNKYMKNPLSYDLYIWLTVTGQGVDDLYNFLAYFINFWLSYFPFLLI